jgi:putative transposase
LIDLLRQQGITTGTYSVGRVKYGGLKPSQLHRLKQLERKNTELNKIVADQALDIRMLKAVNSKNSWGSQLGSPRGLPARKLSGERSTNLQAAAFGRE